LIPDEHRAGIDHPYAADIAFGQLDGQRQGVRMYASHICRRGAALWAALTSGGVPCGSFDHVSAWVPLCGDGV